MKIKQPEKEMLNDFEHSVTSRINLYGNRSDFPKLSDYGIDRQDLDNYLFDKQAILDSGGSQRTQLTLAGLLIVLPVLALSAIPESQYPLGRWTQWAAIALGIFLALMAKGIMMLTIRLRIKKMADLKMDRYINDVLNFEL